MNKDTADIDLLDDYIKGYLDEESIRLLEHRLKSDNDLAETLQQMQLIKESLRVQALQDKLKMLEDLEAGKIQLSNPLKPPFTFSSKLLLLVISLLLVLIIYYVKVRNKTNDIIFALNNKELNDMMLHKTTRSTTGEDKLSTEQKIAYDLFAIHEYEDAIPKLEVLWMSKRDTLGYFYLGISYYAIGKYDKAKKVLTDSIFDTNEQIKEKIDAMNIK